MNKKNKMKKINNNRFKINNKLMLILILRIMQTIKFSMFKMIRNKNNKTLNYQNLMKIQMIMKIIIKEMRTIHKQLVLQNLVLKVDLADSQKNQAEELISQYTRAWIMKLDRKLHGM